MDRREFLVRAMRSHIEPSLFYIPEEKKSIPLYTITGLCIGVKYYKIDVQKQDVYWLVGKTNPTSYPFPSQPWQVYERQISPYNVNAYGYWIIRDNNNKVVWSSWYYYKDYYGRIQRSRRAANNLNIQLPKGEYTLENVCPDIGMCLYKFKTRFIVGGTSQICDIGVEIILDADLLIDVTLPQLPNKTVTNQIFTPNGTLSVPIIYPNESEYSTAFSVESISLYYEWKHSILEGHNGSLFADYSQLTDFPSLSYQTVDGDLVIYDSVSGVADRLDRVFYNEEKNQGYVNITVQIPAVNYEYGFWSNEFWLFQTFAIIYERQDERDREYFANITYGEAYEIALDYVLSNGKDGMDKVQRLFDYYPQPQAFIDDPQGNAWQYVNYFDPYPHYVNDYKPYKHYTISDYSSYEYSFDCTYVTQKNYYAEQFKDWTANDNVTVFASDRLYVVIPYPRTGAFDISNYWNFHTGDYRYYARPIDMNKYSDYVEIDKELMEEAGD